MWTQEQTDQYMLHAETSVYEDVGEFLSVYFSGRLPSAQEIADQLDIPLDQVEMAMASDEVVSSAEGV